MTEEPLDLASLEARPYFGVWAPALTPVDKELRADIHRYATHARWLLHNGCHRIVVFGTTGEAPSFSVAERSSALEGLLKAGLSPQHLVVGTGCAALTDTVTLTKHAVGLRCNTVLMLPPFYFKGSSEEGLFRSYAEIIERVGSSDLNVVLYHFPRMSAVPITPELLRRLCDAFPDQIAGLKDSGGDWDATASFISDFPGLCIFPGSEEFLLRGLDAGGVGCISASANVNPRAIRALYDAWAKGLKGVRRLQEGVNTARKILEAQPLIPGLKHVVAHQRDDPDWGQVRPPLTPLDKLSGQGLLSSLARAGFQFALD